MFPACDTFQLLHGDTVMIHQESIKVSQTMEDKKTRLSISCDDHMTDEDADDGRQASTNHVPAPCLDGH